MDRTIDPIMSPDREPGLVRSIVHPPRALVLREDDYTPAVNELIRAIKKGLPYDELEALRGLLDMPMDRLASLLGIAKATLHRRKVDGRLDLEESDRIIRFARLLHRAVEVLESDENARQWLAAPQYGLGGETPLQFARTEIGAREVEDLLTRIEHGVYS